VGPTSALAASATAVEGPLIALERRLRRTSRACTVGRKEDRLDFRLLGPLEVQDGGVPLDVGAGKQRALLAILLLEAGTPVPVDRLIHVLWEDDPPESAVNSVHVYVSRLRKLLGTRVVTRGQAYALEVHPGELDRDRFEQLLSEGRERLAGGDAPAAARALARSAAGRLRLRGLRAG
jgi:DNA-binding SARP family transcriptional activator